MDSIGKRIYTEFEVTPEEVADLFWSMDNSEMARFFNTLGRYPLPYQLKHVSDDEELTSTGRCAMSLIGEYASPSS